MFRPIPKIKDEYVKGWLATPIEYEVRVEDGNWSPFFGDYNQQKWGVFDTSSCWMLSAINSTEDQLEWLSKKGLFSVEAMTFFHDNGYIDEDGDFSLSERFCEIKGGLRDQGGSSPYAWQLMQKYGCIPREMLTYSVERVNSFLGPSGYNAQAIVDDYFNPDVITPEMEVLGKRFRQYVNIGYQKIGESWKTPDMQLIKAALKQSPLCIGVPVPANVFDWNNAYVKYDGGTIPAHEVELYGINEKGEYLTFDQYQPHLKTLSADYFIGFCTQGIIYPTPVKPSPLPQNTFWNELWTSINHFFNKVTKPFVFEKEKPPTVWYES